jgi:hypothetical protein
MGRSLEMNKVRRGEEQSNRKMKVGDMTCQGIS